MSTREVHPRQAPMPRPGFDQATVAQAMHFGVLSCRPEATLAEVAAIMATHHVHAVVVDGIRRDEGGEHLVWGMVSDLDLVGAAPGDSSVTAGVLAATPGSPLGPTSRSRRRRGSCASRTCTISSWWTREPTARSASSRR